MLKKTQINDILEQLPDEFNLNEIVERLIVLEKIYRGLEDSKNGALFSEDEAKKRLEKWLN